MYLLDDDIASLVTCTFNKIYNFIHPSAQLILNLSKLHNEKPLIAAVSVCRDKQSHRNELGIFN